MYVWDGFSDNTKACGNVMYTVCVHVHCTYIKRFYFWEQFPSCVCHTD